MSMPPEPRGVPVWIGADMIVTTCPPNNPVTNPFARNTGRSALVTFHVACITCVALCCIGLSAGCGCGPTSPGGARLLEFGKKVEVNGVAAVANQALKVTDTIEVFADAYATIKFDDGTRINLFYDDVRKQNTKVSLTAYEPKGVKTVALRLWTGILSFIVPTNRKGIDRYKIEAAHTVTAIEGTAGKISTDGNTDEVALKEGIVEVAHTKGTTTKLTAGQKLGADAAQMYPPVPYVGVADREDRFYHTNLKELYRY